MNWKDIKKLIKEELSEATVTASGTKFNLRTGVNKNDTKLGVKIQFEPIAAALDSDTKSKLEVALQTKLNEGLAQYGIQISKDTDVPRPETIGFFIPLKQIKNLIIGVLEGNPPKDPSVEAPEPEGDEEKLNEGLSPNEIMSLEEDLKTNIKKTLKNFMSRVNVGTEGQSHLRNMLGEMDMIITTSLKGVTEEGPLNESNILKEMRVRDLNEISKIVKKDDFYNFINAGNNIIRDMEEAGKSINESKKYLAYLTKHNIM